MLGALLAMLPLHTPPDFPDTDLPENNFDAPDWADDKNRFEDWLLHGSEEIEPEPDAFY